MNFTYKRGRLLADGSEILVLYGWVVKVEWLANRLTYWLVGRLVHRFQPVGLSQPNDMLKRMALWPPM